MPSAAALRPHAFGPTCSYAAAMLRWDGAEIGLAKVRSTGHHLAAMLIWQHDGKSRPWHTLATRPALLRSCFLFGLPSIAAERGLALGHFEV